MASTEVHRSSVQDSNPHQTSGRRKVFTKVDNRTPMVFRPQAGFYLAGRYRLDRFHAVPDLPAHSRTSSQVGSSVQSRCPLLLRTDLLRVIHHRAFGIKRQRVEGVVHG